MCRGLHQAAQEPGCWATFSMHAVYAEMQFDCAFRSSELIN